MTDGQDHVLSQADALTKKLVKNLNLKRKISYKNVGLKTFSPKNILLQ